MKTKHKNIIINMLLIVAIFFSMWLAYVVFIGGPAQVYRAQDKYFLDTIVEYQELDSARLINRFSLDQVYYIVEVESDGEFKTAWFDTDFKDFKTYQQVDIESIKPLANELGADQNNITLGVYEEELVYVLIGSRSNEIYVSLENQTILLNTGG